MEDLIPSKATAIWFRWALGTARPWTRLFESSWAQVTLLLCFAASSIGPMIARGIPQGPDQAFHYRLAHGLSDQVHAASWYPGWQAGTNNGYGDLTVRFYPPLVHYILVGAHYATGTWYAATLWVLCLFSTAGVLGVYFWTRSFLSPVAAFWSGALYAMSPFHLNEIYQAFMLGQYCGIAVLALSFGFAERLCQGGNLRDVAGLAISYACLVLTHLPVAFIGSLSLLGYTAMRIWCERRFQTIPKLVVATMLSLLASAPYWLRMLPELSWLRGESSPWYDYRWNFVFGKAQESSSIWWVNILVVATLVMTVPGVIAWFKGREKPGQAVNAVALTGLIALVMSTRLSEPVWRLVPGLKEVQFPWRWVTVMSLMCPVLLASGISYWRIRMQTQSTQVLLALGLLLLPLGLTLFQIVTGTDYLERSQFEIVVESFQRSPSPESWWPIWSNGKLPVQASLVEAGDRKVSVDRWEPTRRIFQISVGAAREAHIRTFYYPHWTATAGGQRLTTFPDADGTLKIGIPSVSVPVVLEFLEPSRTKPASYLAYVGWTAIALLFYKGS